MNAGTGLEPTLSVIVPCFNEQANIAELVTRVGEVFSSSAIVGQLILVDDGSRDGTRQAIEQAAAQHPFVRGVYHAVNQGIARAWETGLSAATGSQVCILDADLQYQPEDILRLREALLESGADIAQGWRSPIGRQKQERYYLSRGFNSMLNFVFGMRLRDNKSGFFLCRRGVLQDILTHERRYGYWQSFVMVAAHARRYRIKEVETLFLPRREGTSFLGRVPLQVVARCLADLAQAFVEYRLAPVRRAPSGDDSRTPALRVAHEPPPLARRVHFSAYMATFGATHWMLTSEARHHHMDLEESQWWSPARIRELQDQRLCHLVHHAYRHVPYYRHLMQAHGLLPKDIQGVQDLAKLPLLSKNDVRANLYSGIMSEDHDNRHILRVATSGSTGEPFVCYVDRRQLEFRWAATLRGMEWAGYRFGDRHVRLWHQTLGMTRSQILRERLDAWACRRVYIPAFALDARAMHLAIARIERVRPVLLDGYAESFNLMAQAIRGGVPIHARPRGVLTSAQTLSDESRAVIEQSFGCRVFDKYGAREFSGIAYECEAHAGHHVVAEGYIVEIIADGRPARPGEIGEVVITDLNNTCLPFIRYRIGDLAEAVDEQLPCACGRGLPRIGRIEGRVQSIVIGANGRFIPGTFFCHLMKDYDHVVRRYRIDQERPGEIEVAIVKGPRYSEHAMRQIVELLRDFMGRATRIDLHFVDDVALGATNKRLACISRVPIDFQAIAKGSLLEWRGKTP